MKKLILICITTISACGPSIEEKAQQEKIRIENERLRDDSIKKASEDATRKKIETKLSLQDSVKLYSELKREIEIRLSDGKAALEVERDKMTSIKDFQLGRTRSEREEQIRQQALIIDDFEKEINHMQEELPKIKAKISQFENELKDYQ